MARYDLRSADHLQDHRHHHHHHHHRYCSKQQQKDRSQHRRRARSLSPYQYRHHFPADRSQSPSDFTISRSSRPIHRRSSPPLQRKSSSPYRRESQPTRRYRRQTPPTRYSRGRTPFQKDGQVISRVIRRHRSCGSLLDSDRSRSYSPTTRRRASSKGNFAHNILKFLSTSVSPNKKKREKITDRSQDRYWTPVQHHSRYSQHYGSSPDIAPLITAISNAAMPRHGHGNPHHISQLQRAAREEAAEAERLRKIREDAAADAERIRQAADEVAERTRRNRLQLEMDEAELRRVRALEQLNESERQRREMQIEDRLRQLEDQEVVAELPKKKLSSKKCCKILKIMFGILLSLGLVFVFYLIVVSIMGVSSPFDIFNFDISTDPLLVDIEIDKPESNITNIENKPPVVQNSEIEVSYFENATNTKSDDNNNEFAFDNVVIKPYDTSIGNFGYDVLEEIEKEELNPSVSNRGGKNRVIVEYDEKQVRNSANSNRRSFDISNSPDPYSRVNFDEMPLYYEGYDQSWSPSDRIDKSTFIPSEEDLYANRNFPQIRQRSNPFIHRSGIPSYERVPKHEYDNDYLFQENSDVSNEDSVTRLLPPIHISIPLSTNSFEEDAIERMDVDHNSDTVPQGQASTILTTRTPYEIIGFETGKPKPSWETADSGKTRSLEELEMEIIGTLLELEEQDQTKNDRRLRVNSRTRPKTLTPTRPKPRRRPSSKNGHRKKMAPDSQPPRTRPRIHRTFPPGSRPVPNGGRVRGSSAAPPYRPRNRGSRQPSPPNERFRYDSRRPRNSEAHGPPPEFRYPKSAESIQDIISHMTEDDSKQQSLYTEREKKIESDFHVGDQDHILNPVIVNDGTIVSRESTLKPRRYIGRSYKSKRPRRKMHSYARPIHSLSPIEVHNSYYDDSQVLFHDSGFVSHVDDEYHAQMHDSSHKISSGNEKYHQTSQIKEYDHPLKEDNPPFYISKKLKENSKPFKIMLDVYPVSGSGDAGDYKVKYESNYYIEDERGIPSSSNDNAYSRDKHNDREYASNPVERNSQHSKGTHSTSTPYRSSDEDRDWYGENPRTRIRSPVTSYRDQYSTSIPYDSLDADRDRYGDYQSPRTRSSVTGYRDQFSTSIPYGSSNADRDRYGDNQSSRIRSSATGYRDQYSTSIPYGSSAADRNRYGNNPEPKTQASVTSSRDGKHHSITLHINLYSKKIEEKHGNRRNDHDRLREVSLDIPLTTRFTPMDIFKALTEYAGQGRNFPNAQYLVSDKSITLPINSSAEQGPLLSAEEGTALFTTIEDALMNINQLLPSALQFTIPSRNNQEDTYANNRLNRQIRKLGDGSNAGYSEGFKAIVFNEDESAVPLDDIQVSALIMDGINSEWNVADAVAENHTKSENVSGTLQNSHNVTTLMENGGINLTGAL